MLIRGKAADIKELLEIDRLRFDLCVGTTVTTNQSTTTDDYNRWVCSSACCYTVAVGHFRNKKFHVHKHLVATNVW